MTTSLNIEKSILSSILFDPNLVGDIVNLLQPSDFSHEPYKHIYATILQLFAEDYPIDETMILQKNKSINHGVLVDILATNPVSNILSYTKELKKDSISRRIHLLTLEYQQKFDLNIFDKINNLKDELHNVEGVKKLLPFSSMKEKLTKLNLNFYEIENLKFEYIYPNFIVAGEITFFAAAASSGKSLTTFEFCYRAISRNVVENLIYIDADNSKTTVQQRRIHEKVRNFEDRITYVVSKKREEINSLIGDLLKIDLKATIIVFDSIKNFFDGLDRDKNKDVSKVLDKLKRLRDNGATVIFLHHTNKPKHDIDELMYAGSSAFLEDTSNAFILKHNKDKNTFIFTSIKNRVGEILDKAFEYDFIANTIKEVDINIAKQTKEDEEMINETTEFLKNSRNKPMWSELWKNLTELGYDKEKASKIIKNGEGKLWKFERGNRNNQKLYSLIETNKNQSVEVIFESSAEKVAPRMENTPRSPFYGTSTICNTYSSTSDNSKKERLPLMTEPENLIIEMPKVI